MIRKNKIHYIVLLGLIILNLALFSLNLNDFFLSDDFDWLYLIRNSDNSLTDYFKANYYGIQGEGGSYRPMVNVTFWLNNKIGGLNPLPYHLLNLIFHIGVSFLVYLLVLQLFAKFKNKKTLAILSAVFFAILPNHSEAVIWVAAIADPMAAFFYLLAFYLYIRFRQNLSLLSLIISVLSFIIALLTKEFAITLPLLIVVWELYQALKSNKFEIRNILLAPFGYWVILAGYFLIRYAAIGLAFGYYAEESFRLNINKIFTMFVSLITNLLFYGQTRIKLTNYFVDNKIFFILLLFLIVTLILIILRSYKFKAAFLIDSYFILILPVLPLAYNLLNDEGERYNYLPSVVFCILLAMIVLEIKKQKVIKILVISGLILYFSFNLINKNYNWHVAGNLSEKIIKQDVLQVIDFNNQQQKNIFVALPDNLAGAQVFRNVIDLAIKLYYPQYQAQSETLGVYLRLNRNNYNNKILYWGPYPTGGYIAETFDKNNWVTGFDRRETNDYIFELWNYDYPTYTSNTIRLIFKDEQGGFIKAGEEDVNILIFNEGSLQKIAK